MSNQNPTIKQASFRIIIIIITSIRRTHHIKGMHFLDYYSRRHEQFAHDLPTLEILMQLSVMSLASRSW